MYKVSVHDYKSFSENIIFKNYKLKDNTIFERIRFFSNNDFNYFEERDVKPFYIVLQTTEDKVIGLIKLGHYIHDNKNDKSYSIAFFSIDIEYRNKGLSKIMMDEMFKFSKKQGLELTTSSYSYVGFVKLRKNLNLTAKEHDVVFIDKKDTDPLHDSKSLYDENLVSIHDRNVIKKLPNTGCFSRFL
jgi:hypothetical protein